MALVVAKFGGTSVASPERIRNVAKRLIGIKQAGNDVVAVVSAMGKTTDELVGLAGALNEHPSPREMDMLLSTGEQVSMSLLAMAINARGYRSASFTGWQAGIATDGHFSFAKIEDVDAHRIREKLDQGAIVVVAGFQGVTADGDITTLGRGGSDTTAVALAWGLNADVCEIYSDVDGVYTADPRVAPRAKKLDQISYEDMLELSSSGAGVLQSRAVELARKYHVVIHSRSSFSDAPGTLIKEADPSMEQAVITGVAHDTSEIKVTIRGLDDQSGIAAQLFSALASDEVNVDMIIQNTATDGRVTSAPPARPPIVPAPRRRSAVSATWVRARLHHQRQHRQGVHRGHRHERNSPGWPPRPCRFWARTGVNILAVATSPIRLSVVVDSDQGGAGRARLAYGVRPGLRQRVQGDLAVSRELQRKATEAARVSRRRAHLHR